MGRRDLSLLVIPVVLLALAGVGLACPLIALQGANPARQILTQAHFQAYYPFYALGEHLVTLSWLGLVAAALAMASLLLWCVERFQILLLLRQPRFHVARLILLGAQVWWLLLLATVGGFLWVATATLTHPEAALWSGMVGLPPIFSALALLGLGWSAWRQGGWRDLRQSWSGGAGSASLVTGAALTMWVVLWMLLPDPLELAQGARFQSFLVPPFLWTHFGPWGILAWQAAACGCLGLAVGIGVCGLSPDLAEGEVPLRRRGLAALAALLALLALAWGRSFLVERYHIGLDLRPVLGLSPEPVEGRSVVWLDRPRPAQRSGPLRTYLSEPNLQRVSAWLAQAPWPSAQTRCALAALGNRALWDWDPDRALGSLAQQRDRQVHNSQLNDLMVEVLRSGSPTSEREAMAREFARADRFAWPGPEPLTRVGNLLARYGRGLEARSWLDQARALDGQERALPTPPSATVSGRLLVEGRPWSGARVALFRGSDETLGRLIEAEAGLLRSELLWNPRNRPGLSQPHLRAFYAVAQTGSDGRFRLGPLDEGDYWALARLSGETGELRVQGGCGLLRVRAGATLDLGDLRLERTGR